MFGTWVIAQNNVASSDIKELLLLAVELLIFEDDVCVKKN